MSSEMREGTVLASGEMEKNGTMVPDKIKKKKVSFPWFDDSGYSNVDEGQGEQTSRSTESSEKPKGWKRPEYAAMIPEVSEKRKQMHLTDKCPECGSPTFKFRNVSTDPPSFHVTCMSRPSMERTLQLKKIHGKDTQEYKDAVSKEFCGTTFRIE